MATWDRKVLTARSFTWADSASGKRRLAWNCSKPASQLYHHSMRLVTVVIMTLVMLVVSMVRPPSVIGSVIWVTPVIAVIAAWVITIIVSRISVAVTICGITEANSDPSDPD